MRLEARALRRSLAAKDPTAGEAAAKRLPDPVVRTARVVGGYASRGGELNPAALLARFQAAGARVALPVTVGPDQPLVFRASDAGHGHAPDHLGVPAPPAGAEELRPDLLIVPLLAFDRSGGRLGQGGGYFDRTLATLDASGPVFALGLAYAGQEVARVPMEEHDRPLDAILTEKEYIPVRTKA